MLKTFSWDKINVTKNALFILLQAPTHHSFTFNSQFIYELKHMVRLSKTIFFIYFDFLKLYNFVQQKAWTL